jgi:pimeloyl-ACP methyl ester carboxylesterase
MPSIQISGHHRLYDSDGSGPAVILVHGSLSNGKQWRKLAERLRDRFRVLSLDLYMTRNEDGFEIGDFGFADDVAFVETLLASYPPAHLVGHSYGGVVAARAALNKCNALASLTLIEPSCFHLLDKSGEDFAEIMQLRNDGLAFAATGDRAGQARHFIEYWMGTEAWVTMPERRQAAILASLKRLEPDWQGTLQPHTSLEDYRTLTVPTLLLRARDTRRPSSHLVDLIGAALPDARIAEVASGGHMSPLTNPDPVNDLIERFVMNRRSPDGAEGEIRE